MENVEGIPHFANKSVTRKWLDTRLRENLPTFLFFENADGFMMANIMDGICEVVEEGEWGWRNQAPYRADVLLKDNRGQPRVALEVVHHHPVDAEKLFDADRCSLDVYEIEGGHPPFSKKGLKVLRGHVASRNRAKHRLFTQRIIDLYGAICNPPTLEGGFLRVVKDWRGSLDQHDQKRYNDLVSMQEKFAGLRREIQQQHVFCARCKRPNRLLDGGKGFSYSLTFVHDPNGNCRERHLCDKCEWEVRGGSNGDFAEDAPFWMPSENCPNCQSHERKILAQWYEASKSGPIGYIVDNRTVSHDEFCALLSLVELSATIGAEILSKGGDAIYANRYLHAVKVGIEDLQDAVRRGPEDRNDKAFRPALRSGLLPCPLVVR